MRNINSFIIIYAIHLFLLITLIPGDKSFTKNPSSNFEKRQARMMERYLQEIEMTKDPKLGYVPVERLVKANEDVKDMLKLKDAIAGIDWKSMGPDNVGGRTRAIMFDPNDVTNKRVFAGGVSGGLWRNDDITNVNSLWWKIDDFLDNLTITSLVADPNNSMIFYAGTGEAYAGVTPGLGVFKSVDGGISWAQLANTSDYKYVTEILVRIEDGTSVIYVASKEKHVGSSLTNPSSDTYLGLCGLYRSADDGLNWTQVIPYNDLGELPTVDDIGLDADGHLWVSTGTNSYGDDGGDIYECSDVKCEATGNFTLKFDASAKGFMTTERTVIALAPNDANYIYAVGANSNGSTDIEFFQKSTDGGTNWTAVSIPKNYDLETCTEITGEDFTNAQATYDLCMTVHPTDKNLVLLGGIDLYRTTDGFSNTTHIGSWYEGIAPCNQVIHADHHIFLFRPGSSNEVIFGNDGGIYYSPNAGNKNISSPSFVHHVKNYNVSQLYAGDISPVAGAGEYLAGLQDNGTQEWDAENIFSTSEAVGGDGGFCHIDQNEPNIQIGAYIYNDYEVTTNDWVSSTVITPTAETGRFINPSDYDDTNNILYAASNKDALCKVTGVGSSNNFTDNIAVGGATLGDKRATAIRVDRNTSTTIYVGTDDGKVFKIPNANGATLTSSDISTGLPEGWISSIDVEHGNSNHLLVTYSNYGIASVWESSDAGSSWVNVENNLPDIPVRWGIFSPNNSDHCLLATDLGIWSTDDLNGALTDWDVSNTGLANVRVDMLRWRLSDYSVVAATYGRGLYTHTFGTSDCPQHLVVTDNPSSGTYTAMDIVASNPLGYVIVNPGAVFQASKFVILNKLFEVATGATFEVKIEECPEND